jgi:ABC-type transporter Mla subunit MlaD
MSLNLDSLLADAKALDEGTSRVLSSLVALTLKYEAVKGDLDKLKADAVTSAETIASLNAELAAGEAGIQAKVDEAAKVLEDTKAKLDAAKV